MGSTAMLASGPLIAFALLLGAAGRVEAEPITTFNLSGAVVAVEDPAGVLGGSIVAGDRVSGRYRFDAGAGDSNPDPTVGDYYQRGLRSGISLAIGGIVFASDPFAPNVLIQVLDTPRTDVYTLYSFASQPVLSDVVVDLVYLSLIDRSASAFSDDGLPALPPELSRFDSQFSFIRGFTSPGGTENSYSIFIELESLELSSGSAVPEPSTLVMTAAGLLLGLGCRCSREASRLAQKASSRTMGRIRGLAYPAIAAALRLHVQAVNLSRRTR